MQAVPLDMEPITQCVVKVLDGALNAKQAVGLLMGREAKEEL